MAGSQLLQTFIFLTIIQIWRVRERKFPAKQSIMLILTRYLQRRLHYPDSCYLILYFISFLWQITSTLIYIVDGIIISLSVSLWGSVFMWDWCSTEYCSILKMIDGRSQCFIICIGLQWFTKLHIFPSQKILYHTVWMYSGVVVSTLPKQYNVHLTTSWPQSEDIKTWISGGGGIIQ